MQLTLVSKWFLVGFAVRLALAIIVTLLIRGNLEASMLYFTDIPTISLISVWEKFSGTTFRSAHPYYVSFNLIACLIWGLIFAVAFLTVTTVVAMLGKAKTKRTLGRTY